MFQNVFTFSGRIRRLEYGYSILIFLVMLIVISFVSTLDASDETIGYLVMIMLLPPLWFLTAQGSKRCHDLNKSGYYQLIPLFVFWMIFVRGTKGDNQYGKDPKPIDTSILREVVEEELERRRLDNLKDSSE